MERRNLDILSVIFGAYGALLVLVLFLACFEQQPRAGGQREKGNQTAHSERDASGQRIIAPGDQKPTDGPSKSQDTDYNQKQLDVNQAIADSNAATASATERLVKSSDFAAF